MAFNPNELIIDRVRSIEAYDPSTGELQYRLTQIEEPSLNTTAEGEDVTDAVGALITTLYRSKQATFSGTNSLFHAGLIAQQFGAEKQQGSADAKIKNSKYEIITVADGETSITLKETPVDPVLWIYSMENGGIATSYKAGTNVSETEFVISDKTITLPTGIAAGTRMFVQYMYETADGIRIVNKADEFPKVSDLHINVIFKDSCNENLVYAGTIMSNRAKLNPESVEVSLTATGKHGFEYKMFKDYCDEEGELFEIVITK